MSHRPPRRRMTLAIALVALALAGCGSDPDDVGVADGAGGGTTTTTAAIPRPDELEDLTGQATVTVEVRDNTFRPRNIRVDPGTEIVFELTGRNAHNVLAGVEGAFPEITDPDLVAGDATLVVAAGDTPYYCSLHGTATVGMTGYIVAE